MPQLVFLVLEDLRAWNSNEANQTLGFDDVIADNDDLQSFLENEEEKFWLIAKKNDWLLFVGLLPIWKNDWHECCEELWYIKKMCFVTFAVKDFIEKQFQQFPENLLLFWINKVINI